MINKRTIGLVLLTAIWCVLCACAGREGSGTRAENAIRIACVGDSITFGYGIEGREKNSYPAQLAGLLGDRWQVRNFGVNGATVLERGSRPYRQQRAFIDALGFRPHIVIIALGTNDSWPGNWQHKDEFVRDYVALIRSFQGLDSKPRIWLCYPPPVFPGPLRDADRVIREEIIPRIDETARATGFPVIDFHTPLRDAGKMFPDALHPDARGARVMAETVYTAITGLKPPAR